MTVTVHLSTQVFFPSSKYPFIVAVVVANVVYPLQTFCRYSTTFSMVAVAREQFRAVHSPLTYKKKMASAGN